MLQQPPHRCAGVACAVVVVKSSTTWPWCWWWWCCTCLKAVKFKYKICIVILHRNNKIICFTDTVNSTSKSIGCHIVNQPKDVTTNFTGTIPGTIFSICQRCVDPEIGCWKYAFRSICNFRGQICIGRGIRLKTCKSKGMRLLRIRYIIASRQKSISVREKLTCAWFE